MAGSGPLQSGSAPVTWSGVAQGTVGTGQGKHGEWGLWASPQDLTLTTEGPATQGDSLPAHVSSDPRPSENSVPTLPPSGPSRLDPMGRCGFWSRGGAFGEQQEHEAPGEDSTEVWLDGGLCWD